MNLQMQDIPNHKLKQVFSNKTKEFHRMLREQNLDNFESSDLKTPQETLSMLIIPPLKFHQNEKRGKSFDENMNQEIKENDEIAVQEKREREMN